MKKLYTYIGMMMMAALATVSLTSCEQDDTYEAELLTSGDWQGSLRTFYTTRWRVTGEDFETVMHFDHNSSYATSGRGYEVDYDVRSPYNDYAYCTFKWFIVDGEITLIYDDDKWSPVYIRRYTLYSSSFRGYIDDGTNRTIQFNFENVSFNDWNRYNGRNGRYGEFGDYYYAPSTRADGGASQSAQDFIDRSALCENGGHSYLSGSFARSF